MRNLQPCSWVVGTWSRPDQRWPPKYRCSCRCRCPNSNPTMVSSGGTTSCRRPVRRSDDQVQASRSGHRPHSRVTRRQHQRTDPRPGRVDGRGTPAKLLMPHGCYVTAANFSTRLVGPDTISRSPRSTNVFGRASSHYLSAATASGSDRIRPRWCSQGGDELVARVRISARGNDVQADTNYRCPVTSAQP